MAEQSPQKPLPPAEPLLGLSHLFETIHDRFTENATESTIVAAAMAAATVAGAVGNGSESNGRKRAPKKQAAPKKRAKKTTNSPTAAASQEEELLARRSVDLQDKDVVGLVETIRAVGEVPQSQEESPPTEVIQEAWKPVEGGWWKYECVTASGTLTLPITTATKAD